MATILDDSEQRTLIAVEGADAAMRRGDVTAARAIARQALDQGLEHPFLIRTEALWLQQNGELQEALRMYHHARSLDPEDPMTLTGIAGVVAVMGEHRAALKLVEGALALAPALIPAHTLRGWVLEGMGDHGGARAAYEHALSLDPRNAEALGGLAICCAQLRDPVAARAAAQKALALEPAQPNAVLALAMADMAQGKAADAQGRLDALLAAPAQPLAKATAQRLLGDALDMQDRTQDAFAAYLDANALRKTISSAKSEPPPAAVLASLSGLAQNLAAASADWQAATGTIVGPARQHVFLVGFVRSGATLVEEALAAHPDVADLGGVDLLGQAAQAYLTSADGIARLLAATPQELDAVRDAYWQSVAQIGVVAEGKVLVDKLAFHTVKLALIARLFPQARIVFMLRDPRDTILSCLRQPFEMRGLTASFLDMQTTARLYDAVMTIGAWSLQTLPLAVHQLRYEALLQDFSGEMRAVCDFAGIAGAANIAVSAPRQDVGRWHAYEKELAPVLPILAPWAQKFGYS